MRANGGGFELAAAVSEYLRRGRCREALTGPGDCALEQSHSRRANLPNG